MIIPEGGKKMRGMMFAIWVAIMIASGCAQERVWQPKDSRTPSSKEEVMGAMQKEEEKDKIEEEPTGKQPGERCEVPIWKVGDYWKYRDDNNNQWQNRVVGIEQFQESQIYVVEDIKVLYKRGLDVKTLQFKVNIGFDGRKIVPNIGWPWFYDFPLYIGKKWEKKLSGLNSAGSQKNYLYRYRVLSFEDVAVVAGKFKAFKIECEQSNLSGKGGSVITHLWYSAEVKREVLFKHGSVSGNWKVAGHDYELISFALAGMRPETLK
jgi:hypothetical protein